MELGAEFWVSLSIMLFVASIYRPVSRIIVKALDARSARIQHELDEALKLKEEAQALLSSYQRNQREVTEQSSDIIAHAEKEARRITEEATASLEESLNKRVEMAMQKIAAYESSVMQDLRNHAVDIAISTVRTIIQEHMSKEMAEELVNDAIADMGKTLH